MKVRSGVGEVRSYRAAVVSSEQVSRLDRLWGENLVTWTGLIVKGRGCVSGVISSSSPGRKTRCHVELGSMREDWVSSLLVVLDLLENLSRVQVEHLHERITHRILGQLVGLDIEAPSVSE